MKAIVTVPPYAGYIETAAGHEVVEGLRLKSRLRKKRQKVHPRRFPRAWASHPTPSCPAQNSI